MNIKNILAEIFSVTDDTEFRYLIKIFGIKIKIQKHEIRKKIRENNFYYYKKNKFDITKIPPATGHIRDIQLANLFILDELDRICKKNNIEYWLDWGTLMGAVRHKGFIPWDDDIDVGMMKSDVDRFIEIFDREKMFEDLYIDYQDVSKKAPSYIVKIKHRLCPILFVDIFPFYEYGKVLEKQDYKRETQKLKDKKFSYFKNYKSDNIDEIVKVNAEFHKTILNPKSDKTDIVRGAEFNSCSKNWFFPKDSIFPIKQIDFEGRNFPCVNNYDEYLRLIYGNYMDYPKKISVGHTMFAKYSQEEENVIKELGSKAQNKE